MASINCLPSDIGFQVLTRFDDLAHLYCAILACQTLYEAFRERRSLVLQNVISQQLTARRTTYLQRSSERQLVARRCADYAVANSYISRCKTSAKDAMSLHAASWVTFLSFDHHLWVECSFGLDLIDRYDAQGKCNEALTVASNLWQRVVDGGTSCRDDAPKYSYVQQNKEGLSHAKLAQILMIKYLEIEDYENAVATVLQCYTMTPDLRSYNMLSTLLARCPKSCNLLEVRLVPFLKERIETDRKQTLNSSVRQQTRSISSEYYWTHCLVTVLRQLERYDAAIEVMQDALNFAIQHRPNKPTTIGLGRKLIKSLRDQNLLQEVLAVRKQIFDLLSTRVRAVPSLYLGWASEYIADLRSLGHNEEMIKVAERVWNRMKHFLETVHDQSFTYHSRNAAWSLSRIYKDQGDFTKAQEVQTAFTHLAAGHMDGQ